MCVNVHLGNSGPVRGGTGRCTFLGGAAHPHPAWRRLSFQALAGLGGKRIPISLAAVLSLAAGGLAFLLWRLSGQPFAQYDLVYLLLLPVPFVMGGVLRFNQTPSQSNGNSGSPAP